MVVTDSETGSEPTEAVGNTVVVLEGRGLELGVAGPLGTVCLGGATGCVAFTAGHPGDSSSRRAAAGQGTCRESMPFQTTAGCKACRAYASDLMRSLTFLATDPGT